MIIAFNAKVWQWSDAALRGPREMLASAERGEAGGATASWLAFDPSNGAIVAVGGAVDHRGAHGRNHAVLAPPPPQLLARASRTVDMGGRLVLPGLHDAHIHWFVLAITPLLPSTSTPNSLLADRIARLVFQCGVFG